MRLPLYRMRSLLTASALALALSSCVSTPAIRSPKAAELQIEPEPQLDPGAVANDSAAALDAYDTQHEAWGRRGWASVARLCWWFKDAGAPTPDCGPRPQ